MLLSVPHENNGPRSNCNLFIDSHRIQLNYVMVTQNPTCNHARCACNQINLANKVIQLNGDFITSLHFYYTSHQDSTGTTAL